MIKCSFYRQASDDSSTHYVNVVSVLSAIRDGKYKKEIEDIRVSEKERRSYLKKFLPAATFSGTFKRTKEYNTKRGKYENKTRLDKNILVYSGLVTIDIDVKDPEILDEVKEVLLDDPFVYSFFHSPSGGLKILIKVDSSEDKHKLYGFPQVKDYIESMYNLDVDPSGKNISRLCFVSYDPNLFLNEDSEVFKVDLNKDLDQDFITVNTSNVNFNNEVSHDIKEVYSIAKGWLAKQGHHYHQGGRNNYLHRMACILNRHGLSPDQIVYAFTSNHSLTKEIMGEIPSIVKGVCVRNRGEFGSKPIFTRKKRKGLF